MCQPCVRRDVVIDIIQHSGHYRNILEPIHLEANRHLDITDLYLTALATV